MTVPETNTTVVSPETAAATEDPKQAFLSALRSSLATGAFLKLTLGKYRGGGAEARVTATRVSLKSGPALKIVTRRATQDVTKTAADDDALDEFARLIGADYLSATLFTPEADTSLIYSKKRVARLSRSKPTLHAPPSSEHNRTKSYLVDVGAPYLRELGITHGGEDGHEREVKPSMFGKFRQICRFVEILDGLIAASPLKDATAPRIVDIGSGKGYLTFALHDHLTRHRRKAPLTRGIEANATLVTACNRIAERCAMAGLSFEATRAEVLIPDASSTSAIDVLIALHACDTATDDAIRLGLDSNATLIVVAPCCQQEVAPQIQAKGSPLAGLLRFGLLKQRQAELVTDAMRALALEAAGYEVRVIEFVSTEHTAKNVMLAATRTAHVDRARAKAELAALATTFGITNQRLNQHLQKIGQPHDESGS